MLHTLPGKVLCLGMVVVDSILAFIAVDGSGSVSNNMVIIVAIFGNVTVLLGVVFTGWISLKSARISAGNALTLKESNEKVDKLAEGIDGVAHELKAAKEEGAIAKVAAAHAEGKLEERDAEAARQGVAALAKQDALPVPVIPSPSVEPADCPKIET